MPLKNLEVSPVGPIAEPFVLKFHNRVNVLIGPNAVGKSTVLREVERQHAGLDSPTNIFELYPDEDRLEFSDSDFLPLISVPSSRLSFPMTGEVVEQYSLKQSLEPSYNVLDSRQVFRDFQNYGEHIWPIFSEAGISFDSEDYYKELTEEIKRTIAGIAIACASEICQEILENALPDEYAYRLSNADPQSGISEVTFDYWRVYTTESTFHPITIGDLSSGTQGPFMWILFVCMRLYEHFLRFAEGDLNANVVVLESEGEARWVVTRHSPYSDTDASWTKLPFVLLVDEIENHLHPTWQRRVIPALLEHFPGLQIFATTHSPFVVAGLRAGQVHLLNRDENGVVRASTNNEDIVGWTADEILRVYMGVEDPTDDATAKAARALRALRDEGPRAYEREEEERQTEILRLRQIVDAAELSGPRQAEDERFLVNLESILERHRDSQELNQENG